MLLLFHRLPSFVSIPFPGKDSWKPGQRETGRGRLYGMQFHEWKWGHLVPKSLPTPSESFFLFSCGCGWLSGFSQALLDVCLRFVLLDK